MKPFGKGTSSDEWGYGFALLLGHLRSMVDDEDGDCGPRDLKRRKVIERADAAVCELEQVAEDTGAWK